VALADILTALLLLPTAIGLPGSANDAPREPSPRIALWTDRGDDLYQRGDAMTVFVRTDVDAYVTVFRLDADGIVRVLFPRAPGDDAFVRGGAARTLSGTDPGHTVRVDEYPGEGYLFALVTLDPIRFEPFSRGSAWDYAALGLPARVTDDPYVFFSALLAALVPEDYPDYDYAVLPYYIEEQHGYPRFLCYQCHAYVPPAIWDPYAGSCVRVQVAEPLWWRYPGDWYGGVAVVPPPRALGPRYVVEPRPAPTAPSVPRARGPVAGDRRPAPGAAAPGTTRRPSPDARPAPPATGGRDVAGASTSRRAGGGTTGQASAPRRTATSKATRPASRRSGSGSSHR
jgi:hypothetical protein